MIGCREKNLTDYRVKNTTGPATETYCLKHARQLIWEMHIVRHDNGTGGNREDDQLRSPRG
jgi:hypothetical protein